MAEWKIRRVFTILLFCNVAVLYVYVEDDTSPMYYWSYDTWERLKTEVLRNAHDVFGDTECK